MSMNENELGYVLSSSPTSIIVRIDDIKKFEGQKDLLQVGRYLKIMEGNTDFVIAIIKNIKGTYTLEVEGDKIKNWTFEIECQPLGTLIEKLEMSVDGIVKTPKRKNMGFKSKNSFLNHL